MSDENEVTNPEGNNGTVANTQPTVLESLEARVSALEEKVDSRLSRVEKVLARLFHPSQW